ncbi:hypothetical protein BJV77DRAFT_217779 [Russula vinacea]|nr:hypothetical protein BJV77DRAFT_217779 [Russula vinacea]
MGLPVSSAYSTESSTPYPHTHQRLLCVRCRHCSRSRHSPKRCLPFSSPDSSYYIYHPRDRSVLHSLARRVYFLVPLVFHDCPYQNPCVPYSGSARKWSRSLSSQLLITGRNSLSIVNTGVVKRSRNRQINIKRASHGAWSPRSKSRKALFVV